jgi:hypothetical protein
MAPQSGSKPGNQTPLCRRRLFTETVEKWRFFGTANAPYTYIDIEKEGRYGNCWLAHLARHFIDIVEFVGERKNYTRQ